MLRRGAITGIAIVMMIATPGGRVAAQRVVSSVDLSGTGIWYADTIRSAGSALSPSVRFEWPRATIGASATISRMGPGATSVQAMLAPSAFTPAFGPVAFEAAGTFGGSTHRDGTRTGEAIAIARAHITGVGGGAWGGGGLGRTSDGAIGRTVRVAEAGAWIQRATTNALVTVSPVVVDDTIGYTDYQTALRYVGGGFELGAGAGARSGSVGVAVGGTSRAWASVSVAKWVTRSTAIVASGGSYPVDLTQGFPGGRFVSLAVRFSARPDQSLRRASNVSAGDGEADERSPHGIGSFEVRAGRDRQRTLRVLAPAARTVDLNGDFTQWQPRRLTRGPDGWWTITLPLKAGTHQMNVRVDGGGWLAPPGLTTVVDEFGGVVGILVIE